MKEFVNEISLASHVLIVLKFVYSATYVNMNALHIISPLRSLDVLENTLPNHYSIRKAIKN